MAGQYGQQRCTETQTFQAMEALEPFRLVNLDTGLYLDAHADGVRKGINQRRVEAGEMAVAATRGTLLVESAAAAGINATDNGVGFSPRYSFNSAGTDKYLKIVADGKADLAASAETAIATVLSGQWAAPTTAGMQLLEIALLEQPYVVP